MFSALSCSTDIKFIVRIIYPFREPTGNRNNTLKIVNQDESFESTLVV